MDLTMGIANLSVAMSQTRLGQDLGIAILKGTMDMATSSADAMLEGLVEGVDQSVQLAAQPYLGGNLDIFA